MYNKFRGGKTVRGIIILQKEAPMTSLYIHIPFCQRKCLYCSFPVFVAQERKIDAYLDCLEKEARKYQGQEVTTVYVGGGTPSLLSVDQLRRLMKIVFQSFRCPGKAETTIETNPEDILPEKAELLLALGLNRISLGVQSFNDRYLKYLGRCHDARREKEAFADLHTAGCKNVNVDLMFSFPGQTLPELEKDLEILAGLNPEHVSLYTLTVEPNSRFFSQKITEVNNDEQARSYEHVARFLKNAGFQQYEISNFAKPGWESRHNLNYWRGGNYIGLGLGAHSHRDGRRSWNVSRLKEYMERLQKGGSPEQGFEELTPLKRLTEALVFGLRMNEGVNVRALQERFQKTLTSERVDKIKQFVDEGLLVYDNEILKVTSAGRLVLDEMSAYLV